MSSHRPLLAASLLWPALRSQSADGVQHYNYSYQLYQENDDRIRIESHYIRGSIDLDEVSEFRFQWLSDAISGSSPTGALPGGLQPVYSEIEDLRTGVLGAYARKFGDHRIELEISRSSEEDYLSRGVALSDTWEINEKNTTLSYGFNYLDDNVSVPILGIRDKKSYDFFFGVNQVIDKNTLVSASVTLGYNDGYLNDPYKSVQRTDIESVPDGEGGFFDIPIVNLYKENRPDSRFRQVVQLGGRHYFEAAKGALDGTYRFGHDDFGVTSHTLQLEWRQSIGEKLEVTPFVRYYHQTAADFYMRTIDDVAVTTPSSDPDGSGPNYSADYRLSAFNALSGGIKVHYQFNETFSATAAYEHYAMDGSGGSDSAPDDAYISADMFTFGIKADF